MRIPCWHSLVLLAALVLPGVALAGQVVEIRGDQRVPLAAAREVARRYLSPIVHDRLVRFSRQQALELQEHDVVVDEEVFDLFIPDSPEGAKLGLIVFVSPVEKDSFTSAWHKHLEGKGLALVAGRNSGNDQNVLKRRIPLALHAYSSAMGRIPIDPGRVFVAGFSGGSRVALRLAASYSDVFRGALLIGGSDPFGEAGFVPPPADLMRRFQTASRLVFATGQADLPNRAKDERTRDSFEALCVAGVSVVSQPRLGHWIPEGRYFARALDALELPVMDTPASEDCRNRQSVRMNQALDDVAQRIQLRDLSGATQALIAVDAEFGGLAAPRSVEFAQALDAEVDAK